MKGVTSAKSGAARSPARRATMLRAGVTLECTHPAIKLIAENIEGTSSVAFAKPGAPGGKTKAQATKEAEKAAEDKAEENAIADVTNQQNAVQCAGDCKKEASVPKATITQKAKVKFTMNADQSGTAQGSAKATARGTVECKK